MTDRSGRTRAPFHVDLEQQKKRAKELCRALHAGEPEAVQRFRASHPRARAGDTVTAARQAQLADAQLIIARELGLPSWPRLVAHARSLAEARVAIETAEPPDSDRKTLHLRCGHDIRQTLRDAGFIGDFLEFSNPYSQGPVPKSGDLLSIRAEFIVAAYGRELSLSTVEVRQKLQREERALAQAATDYDRVVLWTEHDSYDQLMLIRCLAEFARTGMPPVLELVSVNRFPGAARFIGLGQLTPEAIRMVWHQRRPLAVTDVEIGSHAWDALRGDDPRQLATIARSNLHGLVDLGPALMRHLRELPGLSDGLSLTQRLILQCLAEEDLTIGQVYARLMREREPLPWLSDLMFLAVVEAMEQARTPAFRRDPATAAAHWPDRRLSITAEGRGILAGTRDWLSCNPPERWVGGVRIAPGGPVWRWDEASASPVYS